MNKHKRARLVLGVALFVTVTQMINREVASGQSKPNSAPFLDGKSPLPNGTISIDPKVMKMQIRSGRAYAEAAMAELAAGAGRAGAAEKYLYISYRYLRYVTGGLREAFSHRKFEAASLKRQYDVIENIRAMQRQCMDKLDRVRRGDPQYLETAVQQLEQIVRNIKALEAIFV